MRTIHLCLFLTIMTFSCQSSTQESQESKPPVHQPTNNDMPGSDDSDEPLPTGSEMPEPQGDGSQKTGNTGATSDSSKSFCGFDLGSGVDQGALSSKQALLNGDWESTLPGRSVKTVEGKKISYQHGMRFDFSTQLYSDLNFNYDDIFQTVPISIEETSPSKFVQVVIGKELGSEAADYSGYRVLQFTNEGSSINCWTYAFKFDAEGRLLLAGPQLVVGATSGDRKPPQIEEFFTSKPTIRKYKKY